MSRSPEATALDGSVELMEARNGMEQQRVDRCVEHCQPLHVLHVQPRRTAISYRSVTLGI